MPVKNNKNETGANMMLDANKKTGKFRVKIYKEGISLAYNLDILTPRGGSFLDKNKKENFILGYLNHRKSDFIINMTVENSKGEEVEPTGQVKETLQVLRKLSRP